jgi:hypothetical protein
MNHGKNLLVAGIAGGFINRVFQFLYTLTENIVGSIGITARAVTKKDIFLIRKVFIGKLLWTLYTNPDMTDDDDRR